MHFPNQVGYVSSLDEYTYIYICMFFYLYIYIYLGNVGPYYRAFPGYNRDIFHSQILQQPLRLSMHSWLVSASKVFLRLRKIKRNANCVVRKHSCLGVFLRLCSYLSGEDVSNLFTVCLKSYQSHLYTIEV